MPIPKAEYGDEYAYYFQYAFFVKKADDCRLFLDTYAVQTAHPVRLEDGHVWVSAGDMEHIYAPYMQITGADKVAVRYFAPLHAEYERVLDDTELQRDGDVLLIDMAAVMSSFGRHIFVTDNFAAVAVDADADLPEAAKSFMGQKYYYNILDGKARGEQNFAFWHEAAQRMIPYRMYIPFGYDPERPGRTLVCFHGGDADCNYMFKHTHGAIERYAERRGYVLLALTSYRKYTFFGGSRFPAGSEAFDPSVPNSLGLTDEEWETSIIAEESVMAQIEDAAQHYPLDMDALYAMGNSGGSLGIFRQVQAIGRPFFRAVACSGGVAAPASIDYELVKSTGTRFLIVMSSEDIFDGQYTGRVAMPIFREHGMDAQLCVVGGGAHLTGWADALDEIFDFFDAN